MKKHNIDLARLLPKGQELLTKTQYQLHDKHKTVCHGKLKFRMIASGFEDARAFIEEINVLCRGQ